MLKLIQLGLTFTDQEGNLPLIGNHYCIWQFNFREFNLKDDMYAQDSIELLKQSGIDFQANEERGIDVQRFGELLRVSGVVLSDKVRISSRAFTPCCAVCKRAVLPPHICTLIPLPTFITDVHFPPIIHLFYLQVKWLTFHSGYDFGYLLKLLTCQALPQTEADFFHVLGLYFPCIFDMKYLMKHTDSLHGGLSKLAEQLDVARIGPQHQAGSDSLLTAATFFKLKQVHFRGSDLGRFVGILYGLGSDAASSADGDATK